MRIWNENMKWEYEMRIWNENMKKKKKKKKRNAYKREEIKEWL